MVNQINHFKDFCQDNQIDVSNIARAHSIITTTDLEQELYSSDAYNALCSFVKAAVNYYLTLNKQYTLENLHEFQLPFISYTSHSDQDQSMANTLASKGPLLAKEEPINIPESREKNARSAKSLPRSPVNLTPPQNNFKVSSITPKQQQFSGEQQRTSSETQKQKASRFNSGTRFSSPQLEFLEQNETKFNEHSSREKLNGVGRKNQSSKINLKKTAHINTPNPKRAIKPTKSSVDIRRKSVTDTESKSGYSDLQKKIDKLLGDKSIRSATQTPKRAFSAALINTAEKAFFEELAVRMQIDEETKMHQKVARDFKQQAAKLLLEHNKQVF